VSNVRFKSSLGHTMILLGFYNQKFKCGNYGVDKIAPVLHFFSFFFNLANSADSIARNLNVDRLADENKNQGREFEYQNQDWHQINSSMPFAREKIASRWDECEPCC
jgi:hypothetical protein